VAQWLAEAHIGFNNRALESEKKMLLYLALHSSNEQLTSEVQW